MYEFRSFRNSDPPHLASIWQSQPPQRGLMQPVSPAILDECVFSKHYFDSAGLIVATRDGKPVGFVHAAFGPDERESDICTDTGVTQLLMVRDRERGSQLPADLLRHAEHYMRSHGAKVIYAGGIRPHNAFYLGLYGGSELPGVLSTDPLEGVLRNDGYREIDRVIIQQLDLVTFRLRVTRQLRQVRRDFIFEPRYAPPPTSWWDACTLGGSDRVCFSLISRRHRNVAARVSFWDVEPLATSWGIRTAGMLGLYVEPEYRRRGLATVLLSEAFKQLRIRGATLIEAQTMYHNQPALAFYGTLGFQAIDCGYVFRKERMSANGNSS